MIIRDDIIQGESEWFALKAGVPGASSFDKILTPTGKASTQRKQYLYQLAGETITGLKMETYQSEAMKRGIELEHEARELFEMIYDTDVKQVGVCYKDEQKKYLCSPDGLMSDTGLEIKSPLIHTHVEYLLNNKLPTKYISQVQGSMLVTGFESWFFMSNYPGLKPLIIEVKRDEAYIAELESELDKFCLDLVVVVKKLKGL